MPKQFNNPYNFTPWQPRPKSLSEEAGDALPIGHDHYHKGCYNGTLSLRLTVQTPLLILDAQGKNPSKSLHEQAFTVRKNPQGHAFIPATSLKGMLRSAFETVTNSRLGVWESHDQLLGYRINPTEAKKLDLTPVRVEKTEEGWQLKQLKAAKLKVYQNKPSNDFIHKYMRKSREAQYEPVFAEIIPSRKPHELPNAIIKEKQERDVKKGYIYVTNKNMGNKLNERFFYEPSDSCTVESLSNGQFDKLQEGWHHLISNYQSTHKHEDIWHRDDADAPEKFIKNEPDKFAWSRHIYYDGQPRADGNTQIPQWDMRVLCHGTLAYAEMQGGNVKALYPVEISRHLYDRAPSELLEHEPEQFPLPAKHFFQLSPADRLFGWANPEGHGALAGKINIREANLLSKDTSNGITRLDKPSTLPILGQPKPAQGRFYLGKKHNKEVTSAYLPKAKSNYYQEGQTIRGRKVYPHHDSATAVEVEGQLGQADESKQNKSILEWVSKGSAFECKISFKNVTQYELGALLYLFTLNENNPTRKAYFRLGNAKPYGFGSVEVCLEEDNTQWYSGEQMADYFLSLDLGQGLSKTETKESCIEHFKTVMAVGYNKRFEQIGFITAFETACRGFNNQLPIHYPLSTPPSQNQNNEENKIFDWFVNNEKKKKETLPELTDAPRGLSYNK